MQIKFDKQATENIYKQSQTKSKNTDSMDIRADFIISSILGDDHGIAYRSWHDCLKISASASIFEVPKLLSKDSVGAGTVSSLLEKIYIQYRKISKSTQCSVDTEQLLAKLKIQSNRIEYVVIDCSRLGYSDCDKDEVAKHNNTQIACVVNRYTSQQKYLNTIQIYTNVKAKITRFTQILLLYNSSLIQVVQKEKFDDDHGYNVFLNHNTNEDCKYEAMCKNMEFYLHYTFEDFDDTYNPKTFTENFVTEEEMNTEDHDKIKSQGTVMKKRQPAVIPMEYRTRIVLQKVKGFDDVSGVRVVLSQICNDNSGVSGRVRQPPVDFVCIRNPDLVRTYTKTAFKIVETGIENVLNAQLEPNAGLFWTSCRATDEMKCVKVDISNHHLSEIFKTKINNQKHIDQSIIILTQPEFRYLCIENQHVKNSNMVIEIKGQEWVCQTQGSTYDPCHATVPYEYLDKFPLNSYVQMESGAIFVPIQHKRSLDAQHPDMHAASITKRHRSAPAKEKRLKKYFDRITEIQHRRVPGKRHYSDSDILEILFTLDSALTRVETVKKKKNKRVKYVKPSSVCPNINDDSDLVKNLTHLCI